MAANIISDSNATVYYIALSNSKNIHYMKKGLVLLSFLSTTILVLHSEINTPPVDSSGAPPSNSSCTRAGCHTGNTIEDVSKFTLRLAINENDLNNDLSIVNETTTYIPGQTYYTSLQLNGAAAVFGFQLIALNENNAQAGAFTVTDAARTQISNAGSRQYIGHKNASSNKIFNFQWTAPSEGESVTFYYASVFGNGNGQNSGDNIYKASATIAKAESSGIKQLSVKSFNVYPTQTLSNVAVKLHSAAAQTAEITLVDMTGRVIKVLHNGSLNVGDNEFLFDISDVQQGNYLLSLQVGNAHTAKHVVKL